MEITGADLTIAKPRGSCFAFFRGQTAMQHERDALEQAMTWRVVGLVHQFRHACPQSAGRAVSSLGLNTSTTRIQVIPPYFGALHFPNGGVWSLSSHPEGRNYSTDWNMVASFRAELLTVSRRDAGVRAALLADADLRDLLNLNATLDGPAFPQSPDFGLTVDTKRASMFPISTKEDLPPYGDGDGESLLAAVDAAHFATAGGPPSEQSFLTARTAYANAATTENARWFRRMAPVSGLKDPGWSPDEVEAWELLTHVYYRQWSAAQRTGDTKAATLNDHRHRLAHLAMAIGADDRLRIVMPADGVPAQDFKDSYGGDQPARELLPQLVAAYL